ncbi:MAG: hypothetical protein ABIG63_16480 [Chloroflexota bacterium]
MTTLTLSQPKRINLLPLILIVLFAATAIYCHHATAKHGQDAAAIRHCLENNDPDKMFQLGSTYYLCVKLPDGKWGLQVRRLGEDGWHEITSFIKGRGRLGQLLDYMERIMAEEIGGLP